VPMSSAGSTQDITERKHIEGHRVMLANELSHRVKNMRRHCGRKLLTPPREHVWGGETGFIDHVQAPAS